MSLLRKLFGQNKKPESAQHLEISQRTEQPRDSIYPSGSVIASRFRVIQSPHEQEGLVGTMGQVYLCLDLEDDRPVALKTFRSEYLSDRAVRDAFLREGAAWVTLGAPPHVVRCYQVVRTGDGTEGYLVLELIAKEQGRRDASLRSWMIPGRPLAVDTALLFALQVARGMQNATQQIPGLVHRDLKPENVLVGSDRLPGWDANHLRVADFGLATVLESLAGPQQGANDSQRATSFTRNPLTRTQVAHGLVGTPLYMAPEIWRQQSATVATDIYALGCILYEMLIGEAAAPGATIEQVVYEHCNGQICPKMNELPGELRELLHRLLALDPRGRCQTWFEAESAVGKTYSSFTKKIVPPRLVPSALDRVERNSLGWSYGQIGFSYFDIGKTDAAKRYFDLALKIGGELGDRRLQGTMIGALSVVYTAIGDMHEAVSHGERQLGIAREIDDQTGISTALHNLGIAYKNMGNTGKAIEYLEKALAIDREIGYRRGEANALGALGITYKNLGDIPRAVTYYERWLAIVREIGDRRGESQALVNLGIAYRNLGQKRLAIQYNEQSLTIAHEIGDRRGEAAALSNIGRAYTDLGEYDPAIHYLQEALLIAQETGDRRGEGICLGNLGNVHAAIGHEHEAFELLVRAIEVQEEVEYAIGVAFSCRDAANCLVTMERTAEALQYAEKAARIFAHTGHIQGKQEAQELIAWLKGDAQNDHVPTSASAPQLFITPSTDIQSSPSMALASNRTERLAAGWAFHEMGGSHFDMGQADVAREYYERAREVGTAEGDLQLEAAALIGLGVTSEALGERRGSIEFYERALMIFRGCGNRNGEAHALNNLGNVYLRSYDTDNAIRCCEQSLAIAREIGDLSREGIAQANLGLAYKNLGNAQRAIEHLGKWLSITRAIGDRHNEGQALGQLGMTYDNLGDVRRAIEYYEQQLAVTREIGDRSGEGNTLSNLGTEYADLGDVHRAIAYIKNAVVIHREIGDRQCEADDLGHLGLAYGASGDAQGAVNYHQQALAIHRDIGYRIGEAFDLANLGHAWRIWGDVQQALSCSEQALKIAREVGSLYGEATALCNLGNAYADLGNAQQAMVHYEQALIKNREIGNRRGEATNSWNLGNLYRQKGDLARAVELMQVCVVYEREIGHPDAEQDAEAVERLRRGEAPTSGNAPELNPGQQAFEAFQRADGSKTMRRVVEQFPFMVDPEFIMAVQTFIMEQVPTEYRPAFEQRLAWLRKIAKG